MKQRFWLIALFCFAGLAQADELQVEYKTFYSHLNKLKSEDTQALQFAFGFKHINSGTLCEIKRARISTQKQQIPLNVSSENRFTMPTERALRLADAMVILDLAEPSNTCDISVQLETKPEFVKDTYTVKELEFLFEQYRSFFNEMGGFMSFMMPQVDGLVFQFADNELNMNLSNGMKIKQGILQVNQADFNKLDRIWLRQTPLRVIAKTHKTKN